MCTVETNIYQFSELSDSAKQNAREWFAQHVFRESHEWEHVYSDAETVGALFGIEIDRKSYKTIGGNSGSEPAIFFSGFSSQGDGACFEGSYKYVPGGLKALKTYAPQDSELHRIAAALQDIQKKNFYRLRANAKHSGHYSHSGCMSVEVYDSENQYRDIADAEDIIEQLIRDFADWIYGQLEKEYEYQMSDEAIEENIMANEYEFDEDGKIFN